MKRGTQIAYVPLHAKGDITHHDVEFGFVTQMNAEDQTHMCRFWLSGLPGTLRTVANSELCYDYSLVKYGSVPQGVVDGLLVELGYETDDLGALKVCDLCGRSEISTVVEGEGEPLAMQEVGGLCVCEECEEA